MQQDAVGGKDVPMFHIILISLAATVGLTGWVLAHSSPSLVARILPPRLTFWFGTGLVMLGAFGAFLDAYYLKDAEGIISALVIVIVGLWFMLAPSSQERGTARHEEVLRRLYLMLGIAITVIVASFYVRTDQALAVLSLAMITAGFVITLDFLRQIDKNRW